jgi:hypothetical protein
MNIQDVTQLLQAIQRILGTLGQAAERAGGVLRAMGVSVAETEAQSSCTACAAEGHPTLVPSVRLNVRGQTYFASNCQRHGVVCNPDPEAHRQGRQGHPEQGPRIQDAASPPAASDPARKKA